MKFTEYPKISSLENDQTFLVDGGGAGTSQIEAEKAYLALVETVDADPAVVHRNIYRGKNLGTKLTDEQLAAIRDGSFEDLYVGDYWTDPINKDILNEPIEWVIADINYWTYENSSGSDRIYMPNHLAIIPKRELYLSQYNDTASNSGGYVGSYLERLGRAEAVDKVFEFFRKENLNIHEFLGSNAFSQDKGVTGVSYLREYFEIPTEDMIFGNSKVDVLGLNTALDSKFGVQAALFRLNPKMISSGFYWLRNISSLTYSLIVYRYQNSVNAQVVTVNAGVRPMFALV